MQTTSQPPPASAGPDVLADAIFTVLPDGAGKPLALSSILARLLTGPEIEGFPRLATEQRSYWWRFLVRCAAKALRSSELSVEAAAARSADELAAVIQDALRTATSGADAWQLHQPDPGQPGFLQPPTPDGKPPMNGYRAETLSLLTSAIGAKNHERKVDTARSLPVQEAVFALIEYQSGVIYGGPKNYPSQLMGSAAGAGSGSPFMGIRLGGSNVETFRHDVRVLLERWDTIRQDHLLRGTVWALWTEPWDGIAPLAAEKLDPAFIPLARLVRLDAPGPDARYHRVWFRPTKAARVADHTGGGNFGDPFTPLVLQKDGAWKVRGTLAKGYDYTEVVRLLFGEDACPSPSVAALMDRRYDSRADLRVLFEGIAYEQGKTLGFHRREVPLPSSGVGRLLSDPHPIREAHRKMQNIVAETKRFLRGASRILMTGSPKPRDGDAAKVEIAASALEAEVDQIYIRELLAAARRQAEGDMQYEIEWARTLAHRARELFRASIGALPTSNARRYEREIQADAWLGWKLRLMQGEVGGVPGGMVTDPDEREEVPA